MRVDEVALGLPGLMVDGRVVGETDSAAEDGKVRGVVEEGERVLAGVCAEVGPGAVEDAGVAVDCGLSLGVPGASGLVGLQGFPPAVAHVAAKAEEAVVAGL